jgi:serine/threonine-protein kinase
MFESRRDYEEDLVRIAGQVGILSQIYHPNLVQCEGFYNYKGVGVLEMELVDGITTRHMLHADSHRKLAPRVPAAQWLRWNDIIFCQDTHRIQPGVAFYILRKVLRGLEVLHSSGYIHCDIKPSNIMIDRFGTVKLIDFGRAVPVDREVDFFLGSPLYMAPEVHQRREMSPVSDLYSAGIVTLEMLAGRPIVDLDADEDEIHIAKLTLPDRLHEFLPPHVLKNTAVESILRRLLAVHPADRFESAQEADDGTTGAMAVHRQLAKADLDADYGRELEHYLALRLPPARLRRV